MHLVMFLSSRTGRLLRIVLGLAFVIVGLLIGGGWFALAVVGLLPLFAGLADVCVLSPLVGQPFRHREV